MPCSKLHCQKVSIKFLFHIRLPAWCFNAKPYSIQSDLGRGLQGFLAHKKTPTPMRTTLRP